ncbi:lipoprotein signal peptidase [Phnomibacter ginsenosidimutans]|uniref:Lipoprotein signal peptidase n=1 Tax=Phnomibacter ginsenosidimutans TaxID=2676868 RepID=A0A6I6GBY1_9BACT|nr:lipoprotein signal peptidase [Phnomibacter ginsenosidimutans]QGW29233.1 lipoprotein signal peptidase [Phnomibacter ginsenosidimutans]
MKKRHIIALILLVLFLDQWLKFYIKTNYYLGEEHNMIGNWFKLHFVENEGMAWGWKLGSSGSWGKMALTLFRMVAVVFGLYYVGKLIKKKEHPGFIICVGLIIAGAIGNLIDSMFYGMVFEASEYGTGKLAAFMPEGGGYAGFLHGKVVDMLYFPIIKSTFPAWVPVWGGEPFEFFSPVFNIADASISIGLIIILLFQNRFFKKEEKAANNITVETNSATSDEALVS